MGGSARSAALELSEELLTDMELRRIDPADVARKASRLARLLDDYDAQRWLAFEVTGYPRPMDAAAVEAAQRSRRHAEPAEDGSEQFWTTHLAGVAASIAANKSDLAGYEGAASSSQYALPLENARAQRKNALSQSIAQWTAFVEQVIGAIHAYVAERHYELRFGSAVESAFGVVRDEVDARIAAFVPDAPQMLAGALENAVSTNPEHWASSAATCRRLLKATADALRPPGPPSGGHPMADGNYINRLIDWIQSTSRSETSRDLIVSDLAHLGARLDSVDDAGHKGAHATVSRGDAARFVTGTYLLLGDILELAEPPA